MAAYIHQIQTLRDYLKMDSAFLYDRQVALFGCWQRGEDVDAAAPKLQIAHAVKTLDRILTSVRTLHYVLAAAKDERMYLDFAKWMPRQPMNPIVSIPLKHKFADLVFKLRKLEALESTLRRGEPEPPEIEVEMPVLLGEAVTFLMVVKGRIDAVRKLQKFRLL